MKTAEQKKYFADKNRLYRTDSAKRERMNEIARKSYHRKMAKMSPEERREHSLKQKERARKAYAKLKADPVRWAEHCKRSNERLKRRYRERKERDPEGLKIFNEQRRRKYRWIILARKYKVPVEAILTLFANAENKCQICGSGKKLCVDHNHDTGEIRGLLCSSCNVILTRKVDLHWIDKADTYLRRLI